MGIDVENIAVGGFDLLEKPTEELDKILKNTKPDQLNDYLSVNRASMADGKAFYYYMKDTLDSKRIRLKDPLYLNRNRLQL